jgi:hypothetical protein
MGKFRELLGLETKSPNPEPVKSTPKVKKDEPKLEEEVFADEETD